MSEYLFYVQLKIKSEQNWVTSIVLFCFRMSSLL